MDVSALVAGAARARGDAVALMDGTGRLRWSELERGVAATAGALVEGGTQPGERVGVLLPNGAAFAVAFWGVLRAGAIVVPINPASPAAEIAYLLTDSGARQVLAAPPFAARVEDATAALVNPPRIHRCDAAGLPGGPLDRSPAGSDDVAVVCYTSGTSGRPKGARLTHGNFLENLAALDALPRLRVEADDVLLATVPFSHIFGLNVVLNAAAKHGAAVLTLERFVPRASLEALAVHGVTIAYGAPPVFTAWAAVTGHQSEPLRLRAAVSGADSLPVTTWDAFRARFGVEILEGYGLTETAPVVASAAASPEVRSGTVGHPIPGVEVRLLDAAGRDVADGAEGELAVRGANVFSGYHNRPADTTAAFREGWFLTGDLATRDPEGYLRIAGRLKDMLIVSGYNVYPREVEEALLTHPGVAEAAVVGVPDARTGERVHAVVVPRVGGALDPEELIAVCRERLARYKVPREVELVPALPRTAMGKVRRSALRDTPA